MDFQIASDNAVYIARIIVSLVGVFVLFALTFWLIRKKNRQQTPVQPNESEKPRFESSNFEITYAHMNPLTGQEREERRQILREQFEHWQAKHLISSEDGKSLFVRTGVKKNGLRYQLAATSQAQAFAMLAMVLLAEFDENASTKTEALFASLLAHPAYREPNLTSWQFLPDLPRSPRLDADVHAEAWVLLALFSARKQWQGLQRFDYDEIIANRSLALFQYWQSIDSDTKNTLPDSTYLLSSLGKYDHTIDWLELIPPNLSATDDSADRSVVAFSLLQTGLQALLSSDLPSLDFLRQIEKKLIDTIGEQLSDEALNESEDSSFSRLSYLACCTPALIALQNQQLSGQIWSFFLHNSADKDDGLGATLKLLAIALLSNQVWL